MGVRGLCNGLGPAAFGVMFYLFGINIVAPIQTEIPASNQTYNSLVLLNTTWQVMWAICIIYVSQHIWSLSSAIQ